MSGEDYYSPPPGAPHHSFNSNNPYSQSQEEQTAWGSQQGSNPAEHSQQNNQSYAAPPGPPPGQQQQQQHQYQYQQSPSGAPPGPHPRRSGTFEETAFVPAEERGEQREALEQFEMSKGAESTEDRDVATLQREFPGLDGSLIAALYGDSKSLAGTREMLTELGSTQGGS